MSDTLTEFETHPDIPPAPPTVVEVVREQALANRKARHDAEYPIELERIDGAIDQAMHTGHLYALVERDIDLELCERLQAHYEGQGFRVSFVPGGTYPSPGAYFRVNF